MASQPHLGAGCFTKTPHFAVTAVLETGPSAVAAARQAQATKRREAATVSSSSQPCRLADDDGTAAHEMNKHSEVSADRLGVLLLKVVCGEGWCSGCSS